MNLASQINDLAARVAAEIKLKAAANHTHVYSEITEKPQVPIISSTAPVNPAVGTVWIDNSVESTP